MRPKLPSPRKLHDNVELTVPFLMSPLGDFLFNFNNSTNRYLLEKIGAA